MPQIDGVSKKKESQLPNAEQLEGEEIFQGPLNGFAISRHMDSHEGRCLFANQEERIQGLIAFFYYLCQGSLCFVNGKGEEEEVVIYRSREELRRIFSEKGDGFILKASNGMGDEIFYVVKGNLFYHTFEL